MKALFCCIFFVFTCFSWGQHVLKGTVTDPAGVAIPGVKVYLENTTYGIITDYNGQYYLELKEEKEYQVHFKMLGMTDTLVTIFVGGKFTLQDIVLYEKATQLESVEVVTKKENIANSIIRNVQDNRKKMAYQFENSTCDTYFKTSLTRTKIPTKKDTSTIDTTRMSLIESLAFSTFIAPDVYHEKIVAHHDYSDKVESVSSSVVDYYMDDIITPVQQVLVDPYIFFEKTQDGDFNLYQSMINLPKISENPITSPIGAVAFTNYSFKLTNVFFENDQKIYEIQVTPLFKGAALLEGTLYILDEIWVVKSFTFAVNSAALTFFKDFTVIQDYEKIDGFWVPVRREYTYTIREEGYLITANTRVNHANYQFNESIEEGGFKNEISTYTDDAFSRDSSFWSQNRPIQLKTEELDFIAEQNRIDSIKQSEHYLDSVDAVFNQVTFLEVIVNGMGFRNRFKQQEIYISPLLNVDFFGVGGFRYELSGSYSKKFDNAHRIKISPNRTVNRYDIFNNKGITIHNFKANGVTAIEFKSNISGKTDGKLLSYYVVDNIPLELEFSIPANQKLDLDLVESSFDLLTNPQFSVAKRKSWMIPTPFVLNDAVMIRQKVKASAKPVTALIPNHRRNWLRDSTSATNDTLRP